MQTSRKGSSRFRYSRSEILRHQNSNLYFVTLLKTSKHRHKIKKEHSIVQISSMYFPRYLPCVKSKYRSSKTNIRVQTNWFKIEFYPCLCTYLLVTGSTLREQKRLGKIQTLLINGRQSGTQANPQS